jgi:hypothetical protein
MRRPDWYGYIYPKALDVMPLPKLFTPDLAARASFSLDESGEAFFTGGVAGGYGILVREGVSRAYCLGLLNSRLLEWIISQTATQMRGGYFSFEARFIRKLPIRLCDVAKAPEKTSHDRMVQMVEQMLEAKKCLASAQTDKDKTYFENKCASLDRQIDALVYELYGLSEEEIKIVEGSNI